MTTCECPQFAAAKLLIKQAQVLINDAIDNHIYDLDNGDKPEPECPYLSFIEDADTFLKD